MNALSADAYSDAILPVLEAAGWNTVNVSSPDNVYHLYLYEVTVGLRSRPRLTVTENPRDERVPLSTWPAVLSLLPTSVEQALAVLRAAGIVPAVDAGEAGEVPVPGCPRCGHRDEQHRFHGCLAQVADPATTLDADCDCRLSSSALPQVRALLAEADAERAVRAGDRS